MLIPNGAGEDEFLGKSGFDVRDSLGIPPDAFLVLHIGSHTGDKGHREALEIFRRARIRHAVFLLVGNGEGGCYAECLATAEKRNATREFLSAGKRVIVRSLTRGETVAAFRSADLFLFPSNVECSPLVLFEAAASGNASEIVEWTSAGRILPTEKGGDREKGGLRPGIRRVSVRIFPFIAPAIPPGHSRAKIDESAAVLEKMYDAPEERRRMGEAGRGAWRDRFTWERIAARYGSLYSSLSGGGGW